MIGLVFMICLGVALMAFGLAATRWGVDSRDDSPDPRRPGYPVGID